MRGAVEKDMATPEALESKRKVAYSRAQDEAIRLARSWLHPKEKSFLTASA